MITDGITGHGFRMFQTPFLPTHTHPQHNMRIGSFATVTHTEDGERVLLMFHAYAHLAGGHAGRSILSAIHLRDGGSIVNDTPMQLGGTQNITTPSIPLFFTNGIPCMATEYPSDKDIRNPCPVIAVKVLSSPPRWTWGLRVTGIR